jgi:hypothetical protein
MLPVVALTGLIHKTVAPNEDCMPSPANFHSDILATMAFDGELLLIEGWVL